MFSSEFTRAINIRVGKLSSWPAPPLEWTGHTRPIQSMCYSPDGTRVVSGSDDKTIRIWDAESGTVIGEPLTGHTQEVNSVAYSPNGRHIISGSDDSTIRIWDAETGTAVGNPLEGHARPVLSIAYSPDPTTTRSESGMRRLVLQSDILSRGMLARCCPLLTLPMGGTSPPDPTTAPFESGMRKMVLQSEVLLWGTRARCTPLLTLHIGSASLLGLLIKLTVCGTHFNTSPSHLLLMTQSILIFVQSLTWLVGLGTHKVAYYTGYPMIFVQACIHPPF